MESNDPTEETTPDFSELLRKHVADPAKGRAFGQIVEHWQSMVYHSAYRRSGDATIAEDVVQKVFTILARKARAVSRHSSPLSWLFQTTKLETLHAMRGAQRRQRKHDALSKAELNEPSSSNHMSELKSTLDQALDRLSDVDRELVLLKFYEGRTYSEISKTTGRSQSANKMRLKRALEKLGESLKGQGVNLSVVAIGPGMLAEFTKASPLVASKVASSSLAGSSSIVTSNLITNTLSTMSTVKTISTATAVVVVLAAIPFAVQMSVARGLNSEVENLSTRIRAVEAIPPSVEASATSPTPRSTIRNIIHTPRTTFDAEGFIADVSSAFYSKDTMQMLKIMVPLGQMAQVDLATAIIDVSEFDGSQQEKSLALSMLTNFVTAEGDIPKLMERYFSRDEAPYQGELTHYFSVMRAWAVDDPAAALAWLQAKKADGSFVAQGIKNSPESFLYGSYIAGLARTDPEKAIRTLERFDSDVKKSSFNQLGFALHQMESDKVIELVRTSKDEETQSLIIGATLKRYAGKHSVDEALAWLSSANIQGGALLRDAKVTLASEQSYFGKQGIEGQIDWLVRDVKKEELSEYTRPFAMNLYLHNPGKLEDWINSAPVNEVRDIMIDSLITSASNSSKGEGRMETFVPMAKKVRDEADRMKLYELILNSGEEDPKQKEAIEQAFSQAGINLSAH